MEAKQFAEELRKLMPISTTLKSMGLDDLFIFYFQSRFLCKPKELDGNFPTSTDEIEILVERYDCSTVEIGMVNFLSSPIYSSFYTTIGQLEADPLVINGITREIEVRDALAVDHVIWRCASNGSNFLAALIQCADYFVRAAILRNLDLDKKNELIENIVDAAGGRKYEGFYVMLIVN